MKEYLETDHFKDTHAATFGKGRLHNVKRNHSNLTTVAKDNLADL